MGSGERGGAIMSTARLSDLQLRILAIIAECREQRVPSLPHGTDAETKHISAAIWPARPSAAQRAAQSRALTRLEARGLVEAHSSLRLKAGHGRSFVITDRGNEALARHLVNKVQSQHLVNRKPEGAARS